MERHINFSDVEAVVKKIYEKYKDFEVEGAVDSRLQVSILQNSVLWSN